MAKIFPYISKRKLSRDMVYPLKFKELEACFSKRSAQNIYLACQFNDTQAYFQEDRDRQAEDGRYILCELRYNPEVESIYYEQGFLPRQEQSLPVLIAQVYAIPVDILHRVGGLLRTSLSGIVMQQLDLLTAAGLTVDHWHLDVWLLSNEYMVECRTARGKYPTIQTIRIPLKANTG